MEHSSTINESSTTIKNSTMSPRGLKRMPGSVRLPSPVKSQASPLKRMESGLGSTLKKDYSFVSLRTSIFVENDTETQNKPKQQLTRTKTTNGPLKLMYESVESEKIEQDISNIRNLPIQRHRSSSANSADNDDIATNPDLRRTSSGSMLLRQTPPKTKRFEIEEFQSLLGPRRSSGSTLPGTLNLGITSPRKRSDDGGVVRTLGPRRRSSSTSRLTASSENYTQAITSPRKKIISSNQPPLTRRRSNSTSKLDTTPTSCDRQRLTPLNSLSKRKGIFERDKEDIIILNERLTVGKKAISTSKLENFVEHLSPRKKRLAGDSDEIVILSSIPPRRKRSSSTSRLASARSSCSPNQRPARCSPRKKRTTDDSTSRLVGLRKRSSSTSRLEKPSVVVVAVEESPSKKRIVDESAESAALKRKYTSTISIMAPVAHEEAIQTVDGGLKRARIEEKIEIVRRPRIPEVVTLSSTESYYSANSDCVIVDEKFATPDATPPHDVMVSPILKKQSSIEDRIIGSVHDEEKSDDDEFGDSTKTIKKGQGSALARSVSLKLTRINEAATIAATTEKSASLPSVAPIQKQRSTASLRFKVSPSTFLKAASPVVAPPAPMEPSTSAEPHHPESKLKSALKSAAKTKRDARTRFTGIDVYYFDRRQGCSTVPSEGEVTLGMHNEHFSKKYFSLQNTSRPNIKLDDGDDEELSEGEVTTPDDDDDVGGGGCEFDYYASLYRRHNPYQNEQYRRTVLRENGIEVTDVDSNDNETAEKIRAGREKCGCECKNGICKPHSCECAVEGIGCLVDTAEDQRPYPCNCSRKRCRNPFGRRAYDAEAVRRNHIEKVRSYNAMLKTGIEKSPVVTKFADSDDDDDEAVESTSAPTEGDSPTRYPVTPVFRRRPVLSDVRESLSETPAAAAPSSTSLADRIEMMNKLENDVVVEATRFNDMGSAESLNGSGSLESIENVAQIDMSPVKERSAAVAV
ncbi:unnamed protein product [Caenorhabditis bovis]|uniref:Cysteine/serine-rich nuclear protein N-terminal domain-containing protein n=1 Tax=Caenorhabditis bovis TaxID=2654633 RepID=A0A8S1F0K9_9PELO|nr:unnamed protein product [Caenorhabditis bovis]